jgi:23S rRNA (cytosine1962-C5)-methyltransferase
VRELVVNKKAALSLKNLFLWVYKSDIIDKKSFVTGEIVKIVDEKGSFLAIGYVNLKSVISVRVLSFKDEKIDRDFFEKRVEKSIAKRENIPSNSFRLIHSEADLLPGLIVDIYGEYIVVMFLTAGMLNFKNEIVDILQNRFSFRGMIVTTSEDIAKKEGFEFFKEIVGEIDEAVIEENGIKFVVDLLNAQKTGFYLDQRSNRKKVANYLVQKGSVLDCFSNIGGFGLYCAKLKDAKAIEVDISKEATKLAKRNFEINGVTGEFVVANVFDYLRKIRKKRFDMVILDPPSFAKSRARKEQALKGFKDIAVNGMKVVKDGGYMAIFSCSFHIGIEDLKEVMQRAARDNKRFVEVVEHLYQDIDHPYILSMPNTLYLTGLLCKITSV